MRELKPFYALFKAEVKPAPEAVKPKAVPTVRLRINIRQLYRGALAADLRVERRREDWGQNHIDPALHHQRDIVAHNLPVLLAPGLQAVIIGKAVGVEPLGVHQLLLRQSGG